MQMQLYMVHIFEDIYIYIFINVRYLHYQETGDNTN